jgi:hypothetical protein
MKRNIYLSAASCHDVGTVPTLQKKTLPHFFPDTSEKNFATFFSWHFRKNFANFFSWYRTSEKTSPLFFLA